MSGRNSKFIAIFAAAAALLLAVACSQSDIGITTKVKAKLAADSSVKASQIHVETKDRVVTLSGLVDNDAARTEAVALARGTDGVTDVVDSMAVSQAAQQQQAAEGGRTLGQTMDDAAITAAVKSKLMVDSVVGGRRIDVDTKDGVVSLSGPVKSQTEKDAAVRIARETSGVKDVQDNLVVQSG